MLTHDHLAFHNVAELPPTPGGGLHLARFPQKNWSDAEPPVGNITIRSSNGCEIRFVSNPPHIRLYLRVLSGFDNLSFHLRGSQIIKVPSRLEEGRIHAACKSSYPRSNPTAPRPAAPPAASPRRSISSASAPPLARLRLVHHPGQQLLPQLRQRLRPDARSRRL